MKICVLIDSYSGIESPLKELDVFPEPHHYLPGHVVETHSLNKTTVAEQVKSLAASDFDVFMNLCDGEPDEDLPGLEVVQILEELGLAYTGGNVPFYSLTRAKIKQTCDQKNIPTPAAAMVFSPLDLETAVAHLHYPLIVKHFNSYSSLGLKPDSRVETFEKLQQKVVEMITAYQGD